MEWCNICGKFDWANTHKCPPLWECKHEYDDEYSSHLIFTDYPGKAAEMFKEWSDSYFADWNTKEEWIIVKDRDGNEFRFYVRMEIVPSYTAYKDAEMSHLAI